MWSEPVQGTAFALRVGFHGAQLYDELTAQPTENCSPTSSTKRIPNPLTWCVFERRRPGTAIPRAHAEQRWWMSLQTIPRFLSPSDGPSQHLAKTYFWLGNQLCSAKCNAENMLLKPTGHRTCNWEDHTEHTAPTTLVDLPLGKPQTSVHTKLHNAMYFEVVDKSLNGLGLWCKPAQIAQWKRSLDDRENEAMSA